MPGDRLCWCDEHEVNLSVTFVDSRNIFHPQQACLDPPSVNRFFLFFLFL